MRMTNEASVLEGKQVAGAVGKPAASRHKPKYPGIRVTCNGNQLVTQYVETRVTEGGVFTPLRPAPRAARFTRLLTRRANSTSGASRRLRLKRRASTRRRAARRLTRCAVGAR